MFTGLDDIDWASLRHAYGPAEDVPVWLRGLVDPDPAVRALTLWQLTGETERTVPVLTAAWHGDPGTRPQIANAATGPLAAALEPLFRAEIAANRRHNVSANGWSSDQVTEDDRLLELCRAVGSGRRRS